MTRKHTDGRLLDEKGHVIGRWDDNVHGVRQWAISHGQDPDAAEEEWRLRGQSHRPIVKRVEGYYEANKHKASGGKNWLRVLVAFGQYQERGITPYSAAEARESAKVWRGWEEVALALEGLESANFEFAHGYDPKGSVYQQDGADGYVAPDDERWANERQAKDNYKSEQDDYAEKVREFQALRDSGDPAAQQGFDEWQRTQTESGKMFPFNGVYVEDSRTGCIIPFDKVARRRDELTAENVRYRFDVHPNGMAQISWLALNYEGCLCFLPHSTETKTRMVPAEEVRALIVDGWRVLTHKAYSKNQSGLGAKDDKFESFRLWVQYSPSDKPLGICPTQGDSSDGKWKHDAALWADILTSHRPEEIAPVDAPIEIANAIQAGDWAEVARLAKERS